MKDFIKLIFIFFIATTVVSVLFWLFPATKRGPVIPQEYEELLKLNDKDIVFRFVDYECKPLPNREIYIERSTYSGLLSVGNGGVNLHRLTTDDEGYIFLKSGGSLAIMEKHIWEDPYHGRRNRHFIRNIYDDIAPYYNADILTAKKESSKISPVYIYPYSSKKGNEVRGQTKSMFVIPDIYSRDLKGLSIHTSGDTAPYLKIDIKSSLKSADIAIDIFPGNEGGGIIPLENNQVLFSDYLPVDNYLSKSNWLVKKSTMIYPSSAKARFYVKVVNARGYPGVGYGRLTLVVSLLNDKLIIHNFYDGIEANDFPMQKAFFKSVVFPIYMPQENCGGTIDRHDSGYFGNIYETRHIKEIIRVHELIERRKEEELKVLENKGAVIKSGSQAN